jgi:hypothetical protein
VFYRGLEPGGEGGDAFTTELLLSWSSWITGTPALGSLSLEYLFGQNAFEYFVFDDTSFNIASYLGTHDNNSIYSTLLSSIKPLNLPSMDFSAFKQWGGKLLMYHGWNDSGVPPRNSVDLYHAIKGDAGSKQGDFVRLFMAPGMGHCAYPLNVTRFSQEGIF